MKTIILLVFLAITSCNKDSVKQDPIAQLPPETQTGANTFGVTINGKVYIPRDPTGVNVGPSGHGMVLHGASDFSWYEIEVVDGASAVGFQIYIHLQPLVSVGNITLKQSNFQNQLDSSSLTHIYFKIWDNNISNYAYYGSIMDFGEINITRLDSGVLSGNFKGKFVRYDNPNQFINIEDGRFDLNGFTLPNTKFP